MRARYKVLVFAYCLLPNHIHLLLSLGENGPTLGQVIGGFKSLSTRAVWQTGLRGQVWQSKFYDHIVRNSESMDRVAEYILQNPVRKGLVDQPEDYPWSGCLDLM